MGRPTPGIKNREWHRKLERHGCVPVRPARGGGHLIYVAPSGATFVTVGKNRKTDPTFKAIEPAAKALGLTIQEVLK